jgi:threonine synthase
VEEVEILDALRNCDARLGEVWDPHSATAVVARERLASRDWILVSTAHPAKFETVVEPLIGREVPVPPARAELLERHGSATEIDAELGALREALTRLAQARHPLP